jgi:hypothetical protein
VKVVQELMRHASSRFTLEVYTQAKTQAKRDAQQRIVELVLPVDEDASNLSCSGKDLMKCWMVQSNLPLLIVRLNWRNLA